MHPHCPRTAARYSLDITLQPSTNTSRLSGTLRVFFTISRVIRDYTMTLPPQPAETWHSHYDDPNGDLTVVSNERVKFRTSARLLAKTW
jgi:hypothetical protein